MATHSSILAWEIPWTEEPGRLQFMGLQRVGHDLATKQEQRLSALNYQISSSQWMEAHCIHGSFKCTACSPYKGMQNPQIPKATMPFYTRNFSIWGFWYPWGSWKQGSCIWRDDCNLYSLMVNMVPSLVRQANGQTFSCLSSSKEKSPLWSGHFHSTSTWDCLCCTGLGLNPEDTALTELTFSCSWGKADLINSVPPWNFHSCFGELPAGFWATQAEGKWLLPRLCPPRFSPCLSAVFSQSCWVEHQLDLPVVVGSFSLSDSDLSSYPPSAPLQQTRQEQAMSSDLTAHRAHPNAFSRCAINIDSVIQMSTLRHPYLVAL